MLLIIVALPDELSSRRLPAGVQLVHCGVGKINAALATAVALARHRPTQIVNYGTAGRISARAHGLLEVAEVIQRDMLAEPLAPRGTTPYGDESPRLVSGRPGVLCATGDSFVMAADPWFDAQGVDVVDMELFAIAVACRRAGVPWRAFKFVTDGADEGAADEWSARVGQGEVLFLAELQKMLAAGG